MFILDCVIGIIDLISDIQFGKKYGFGSLLWDLAGAVCLITALVFFRMGWIALGVFGVICFVTCLICGFCRMRRDMKRTRGKQAEDSEKKDDA